MILDLSKEPKEIAEQARRHYFEHPYFCEKMQSIELAITLIENVRIYLGESTEDWIGLENPTRRKLSEAIKILKQDIT